MPNSKDIAEMLEDSSVGRTLGTDLFYSFLPDTPNDAVCVYDDGDTEAPHPMVDLSKPEIQIVVRDVDYDDAWSTAVTIKDFLHKKVNHTQNSTRYIFILANSGIMPAGRDSKNRIMLSLNFRTLATSA